MSTLVTVPSLLQPPNPCGDSGWAWGLRSCVSLLAWQEDAVKQQPPHVPCAASFFIALNSFH
jgi:hypothetical protein